MGVWCLQPSHLSNRDMHARLVFTRASVRFLIIVLLCNLPPQHLQRQNKSNQTTQNPKRKRHIGYTESKAKVYSFLFPFGGQQRPRHYCVGSPPKTNASPKSIEFFWFFLGSHDKTEASTALFLLGAPVS